MFFIRQEGRGINRRQLWNKKIGDGARKRVVAIAAIVAALHDQGVAVYEGGGNEWARVTTPPALRRCSVR